MGVGGTQGSAHNVLFGDGVGVVSMPGLALIDLFGDGEGVGGTHGSAHSEVFVVGLVSVVVEDGVVVGVKVAVVEVIVVVVVIFVVSLGLAHSCRSMSRIAELKMSLVVSQAVVKKGPGVQVLPERAWIAYTKTMYTHVFMWKTICSDKEGRRVANQAK